MGILDRGAHDIYFQIEEHHFLKKILFSDSIRQYLIKTKIIFIMFIRLKKTKTKGLWATSLTRKTVPINEHIFVKL